MIITETRIKLGRRIEEWVIKDFISLSTSHCFIWICYSRTIIISLDFQCLFVSIRKSVMILVAFFTLKGAINDISHFAQPSWLVGWLVGFGASVLKTFWNTFRLLFRNNNNRVAISFKSTTTDQMAMNDICCIISTVYRLATVSSVSSIDFIF